MKRANLDTGKSTKRQDRLAKYWMYQDKHILSTIY